MCYDRTINMTQNLIEIERNPNPGKKPDFSNLKFGQNFSDHMFVAHYSSEKSWHNLKICPYQNFNINPAAAALHYGQALFEGMKAYRWENGEVGLFRPEFNWKRLALGGQRLCMQVPPKELFLEGIKQLVDLERDWVPDTPHSALYIRPTLIATESFLGIRPSNEYLFFVILSPVGPYYPEGLNPVKIWVEKEYLRAAPGGLGSIKAAANYGGSLIASEKAKEKGFTQVLWLDTEKKYIEEVGTMNVFFVFKDEIVTPALGDTVLGGKTRDSAIQLLKDDKHNVQERKLSLQELLQAEQEGHLLEVFGTGTAAVVSPVGRLASNDFDFTINEGQIGKVSQKLFETLTNIQYGRGTDSHGWRIKV